MLTSTQGTKVVKQLKAEDFAPRNFNYIGQPPGDTVPAYC